MVAPLVVTLHCIDPSIAIVVTRKNLNAYQNFVFHKAGVDDIPLRDHSMDFGYTL